MGFAVLLRRTAVVLVALLACNRAGDAPHSSTSPHEHTLGSSAGAGAALPVVETAEQCPPGRVQPPFADGAWSVHSLVCARETLAVGDRFVLRAVLDGGEDCLPCPPNAACAPCGPYRLFRDAPGDPLFATLNRDIPPNLVQGARVDLHVQLDSWGAAPPNFLVQVVGVP